MTVVELEGWDKFQEKIKELSESTKADAKPGRHVSELLFRGQQQAAWKLETTLERWAPSSLGFGRYYIKAAGSRNEIESWTDRTWNIPDYLDYMAILENDESPHRYPIPDQLYEYLVYLRHHGFPSPLLDWSASPYVAAYFAFRTATPDQPVAIYAFQEYTGGGKGGRANAPRIVGLGPYVSTHRRHYAQQCRYTVCFEGEKVNRKYCAHEKVTDAPDGKDQDLLWKFVLPGTLRKKVLSYLYVHNITAFTLFGSEESLMEALAIKEFILES